MGEPNLQLLSFMAVAFGVKEFVETGTAHGETAAKAIKIFPGVHTIELAQGLFEEARARLGERVDIRLGKSTELLGDILAELDNDAQVVYWLDAHYSGGPTAGADEQCGLLREIEIINDRPGNNDFIIIDDAHVFFSPAVYGGIDWLDVRQWPDVQQIFQALGAKDRYTFILASWRCAAHGKPDGIVMPEDAIVSVPIQYREQLYDWLRSLRLEH